MAPSTSARLVGLDARQVAEFATRFSIPAGHTAVLPPTVDPAVRRPLQLDGDQRLRLRSRLGVNRNGPLWLWIGLQPLTKGLDRLVRALGLVPDAQILVCGLSETDRKMRPILRLARRLGVDSRMRCLGFIRHDDDRFYDAIRTADVLAHPARNDITGTVILEAIVNGLPVVATAACGYSCHVQQSESGIVVAEPLELGQLTAALQRVYRSRERLSENGIAYGADPMLYEGVPRAIGLIEAPLGQPWPEGMTSYTRHVEAA